MLTPYGIPALQYRDQERGAGRLEREQYTEFGIASCARPQLHQARLDAQDAEALGGLPGD